MARVSGPLFSMSASGTVGKAITFGIWKGRPWCRVWVKPENPNSDKQIAQRYAMKLIVAYWQTFSATGVPALWDAFAAPFGMSGFNMWVKRALIDYTEQLGSGIKPVSVTAEHNPPDDVFTWVDPE